MKKTSIIFLASATFLLAIIFFAGLKERIFNMPQWFANPPTSFEVLRQQMSTSQHFWIPLQILFLIATILAFIANWQRKEVRVMMLWGTLTYLIIIIITATYFVHEILDFSSIPANAKATPELLERVHLWFSTTVVRNILTGISVIFFVLATSNRFKMKGINVSM